MTILQYPGKKNSIAQWIIGHFPHEYQSMTYLEPFFGSGSIFFHKERSAVETVNDLDSDIFNLFKQIRDNSDELMFLLMNTPWNREEFNLAYEKTDDLLEQARRCIVRFWFNFGADARTKNGMRFEMHKNSGSYNNFHLKLPEVIALASERLKHSKRTIVQIENRSVFELIPKYNRENVLMYLDPPYVLGTRKNKKIYKHEFSDDEHEELLKHIVCSKAKVIVSGYMNELYSCYLNSWRLEQKTAIDQAKNRKVECIWMNYADRQKDFF